MFKEMRNFEAAILNNNIFKDIDIKELTIDILSKHLKNNIIKLDEVYTNDRWNESFKSTFLGGLCYGFPLSPILVKSDKFGVLSPVLMTEWKKLEAIRDFLNNDFKPLPPINDMVGDFSRKIPTKCLYFLGLSQPFYI